MSGQYTFEAMLARAKSEIERDILEGVVPFTVQSFSELHDYVDANAYGGACDDEAPAPEVLMPVVRDVQHAVDAWLKERPLFVKRPQKPQFSLEAVKAAFWKTFHKSGEKWFSYIDEDAECEYMTKSEWDDFLENLLNAKEGRDGHQGS